MQDITIGVDNMKRQIVGFIELIKDELVSISKFIHDNPETGYKEFKAQDILTGALSKYGFSVEKNFLSLGTEFKATIGTGSPTIAYLCEYDALPGIGHACGHNIIGTAGVAAALGLGSVLDKIGGSIVVFGTPAEETSGAKVIMSKNNVFSGIDAAIMIHPSDASSESGSSLAIDAIEFIFRGKASHAAASPEQGVNALNACIETFNIINAMRQHFTPDIKIHGIITEGGVAANIVPDRAVARFYVRSQKRSILDEVTEKVKDCAKAAAMGVGAQVDISNYELSYDNMITNHTLSRIFSHNLKECGIIDIQGPRSNPGSIDMGNVSHIVPCIHPYIKICENNIPCHTAQFEECTVSELANENMIKAGCAMALTGYDLITSENLLDEVREEFKRQRSLI